MNLRGRFYRVWARLLHRVNLHHAKVCHMDDGTILDVCDWCGLRSVRTSSLPGYRAMTQEGAKK